MKIKDFCEGDAVCILTEARGSNPGFNVAPAVATKVGTKYITVKNGNRFFRMNEEDEYLVIDRDWNRNEYLFKTKTEAERHAKKEELIKWMRQNAERKWSKLSLEQLEAIQKTMTAENI